MTPFLGSVYGNMHAEKGSKATHNRTHHAVFEPRQKDLFIPTSVLLV